MNKPSQQFSWSFLGRVLVKALLLFAALNLLFAWLYPLDALGRLSLYNLLFPGRERLPFGENPAKAYNLSLYNLEAMFSSLRLNAAPPRADGAAPPRADGAAPPSQSTPREALPKGAEGGRADGAVPKTAGEFRVLAIGDSSVWGTLLRPQETLAGQINALSASCGAKQVTVYNLGYPTLSVSKDLMLLEEGLSRYQPDLVLWPLTLEGLPRELQLSSSPLLANNAGRAERLNNTYNLKLNLADLVRPSFWDQTIIGARRPLADLARLQFYGLLWGATGIDQTYPEKYDPAARDLSADLSFHGRQPPSLDPSSLALEALSAGAGLAAGQRVPVIFVNEPILVSAGKNSDLRYNFFYPRWAYDQYRQLLSAFMQQGGYTYIDLWNLVPEKEFTNSAIHLTPAGEKLLAEEVGKAIGRSCR